MGHPMGAKIYQSPGGVCRLVEIAVGKHTAPHRPATRVAANTSMRRVVITHGRGFGRERIVLEMERTRYGVLDPTGSSHRRHRPSPLPCSTDLPIYLYRVQASSLTHARMHPPGDRALVTAVPLCSISGTALLAISASSVFSDGSPDTANTRWHNHLPLTIVIVIKMCISEAT